MNKTMLQNLLIPCLLLLSTVGFAKAPEIYPHRGVRAFLPENTLPGYAAALRLGTEWVDMDVVLSKDGVLMVSHDPLMNPDIIRDQNGQYIYQSKEALSQASTAEMSRFVEQYAVKNLTQAQLQEFDVGRINPTSRYAKLFPDQMPVDGLHMPTLIDVIHYVKSHADKNVKFQIEIKTDPTHPEFSADPVQISDALYKVLRDENLIDTAEIQAFDFRCLYELQKLDKRVRTAYLTSRDNERGGVDDFFSTDKQVSGRWSGGVLIKDHKNSIPQMIKDLGGFAWEPEDAELTKENLDEAHRLGLKVVVWTWPEPLGTNFSYPLMEKMIAWGVDGIITDDPARLMSMLAARGINLPHRFMVEASHK